MSKKWDALEVGKCYESDKSYMKGGKEYLGKLVTKPIQSAPRVMENNANKVGRGGQSTYTAWSADFEDKGVTTKRWQTVADDGGRGGLGFYFNEVECVPAGGRRKKQTKKTKRTKRRRTYKK
jgi:hypothetical protein